MDQPARQRAPSDTAQPPYNDRTSERHHMTSGIRDKIVGKRAKERSGAPAAQAKKKRTLDHPGTLAQWQLHSQPALSSGRARAGCAPSPEELAGQHEPAAARVVAAALHAVIDQLRGGHIARRHMRLDEHHVRFWQRLQACAPGTTCSAHRLQAAGPDVAVRHWHRRCWTAQRSHEMTRDPSCSPLSVVQQADSQCLWQQRQQLGGCQRVCWTTPSSLAARCTALSAACASPALAYATASAWYARGPGNKPPAAISWSTASATPASPAFAAACNLLRKRNLT